jgi:hypothetical protein
MFEIAYRSYIESITCEAIPGFSEPGILRRLPGNCDAANREIFCRTENGVRRSFLRHFRACAGSALYGLEGDLGSSAANATSPAPEVGHEVNLIKFAGGYGQPLDCRCSRSLITRPSSRLL